MKWGSALTLGMVIQANGCVVDPAVLASQWTIAVLDRFFASYAFDLLNVQRDPFALQFPFSFTF
jgi:hypothetical protein